MSDKPYHDGLIPNHDPYLPADVRRIDIDRTGASGLPINYEEWAETATENQQRKLDESFVESYGAADLMEDVRETWEHASLAPALMAKLRLKFVAFAERRIRP